MGIVFSHRTSLALIRAWRRNHPAHDLPRPCPFPLGTKASHALSQPNVVRRLNGIGVDGAALIRHLGKLDCLYHPGMRRPGNGFVRGRSYAGSLSAPLFLELGDGLYACSPAAMLAQLSGSLPMPELASIASDQLGSFSRDPIDPARGSAVFGIPPFARIDEMLWMLASLEEGRPVARTLRALGSACPNAWSPLESTLATMLTLPAKEGGYDLGPLVLNQRVHAGKEAPMTCGSRVPDIEFLHAPLCLNYDGEGHLDLRGLETAAMQLAADPGDFARDRALQRMRRQLREKYVDDRRRERDLASNGKLTLTVTKEDLLERGALDLLVRQLIKLLEKSSRRYLVEQRRALDDERLARRRGELISGLLFRHP